MSRQMPIEPSPTNNIVEFLAVSRQQIEESHHDLVNILTQQMATVLTPMIENSNAKIEYVAHQVNDLAETINPALGRPFPRNQAYNYHNHYKVLPFYRRPYRRLEPSVVIRQQQIRR
ncbi:hypothetical protein PIB30_092943 [Stylosanthes scabra]|uniref:Uncharacterized protein n=1 Tax=Stylosanthes scabra TaxID=79078 RepID=A0ABU6XU44_9FABA|nr:hypothetical protein [Stylosanthes scabra]